MTPTCIALSLPVLDIKLLGALAALGSACSWAVAAILLKNLGDSIPALAMTLAKGLLSIVLLGAVLFWVGVDKLSPSDWMWLTASGVLGIAVGDTLFFMALRHIGAQLLVLMFMVGQALTALLALVFLHETPTSLGWLGIALVIGGVGVILFNNLSDPGPPTRLRGVIYGLLSVLCMSSSVIVAKMGLGHSSALQATLIRMVAATIGVAMVGVFGGQIREWVASFRDFRIAGTFSLVVLIVTFGGFWLSLVAVKYVDVAIANTLISTEPVFILPLSAIFLKEKVTLPAVAGATIALVGVCLLCST